ncbi:GNAT family N-acetyltransferase [Actinospica sp.]|jgi:ribosomal protein S18 acetylase RimI-like enzyme|uniref:GNAT family N-acetyltransferase n=1 Tax=Actinospica sp. TaxID=1872142 RepID=UPI002CA536C2|nr:GNAT family N-acetyltransferase [Actinospica sp.]HWG25928.1 GNAT family N-acetyltransferase [Actinospica sp.]
MDLVVRAAREAELERIGELTAEVYESENLAGPEYVQVLRDARSRWESPGTTLLVAFDDGAEEPEDLLGTVVFAGPGSPWRDLATGDEVEFRMLATADPARGRGVGESLVRACIDRAKRAGATRLVLSTGPQHLAAHRLYDRLGFTRVPERDWRPRSDLDLVLRAYALEL